MTEHHHNHSHDHHHHHHGTENIKTAFFLNAFFTVFELIGGFYVNSVAIISDAIHDLGDSLSLGTAWYLQIKSEKAATNNFSFGYKRFSVLGALINSVILILGSSFVLYEAVGRLLAPEASDAFGMMIFAIFGVLVNGYAAWKVSSGSSLNEKVISWHLMEDVLGWAAVLIVSVVLQFYENQYLDPALSILITLYILWNVIARFKETISIFLQGSPTDVSIAEVRSSLLEVEGICSLHHSHLWSLDGENHVFTAHVKLKTIENLNELIRIKKEIRKVLGAYSFSHCTIEVELDEEECRFEEVGGV